MPIGPYPDFSTCVTAMQNKGHSQDSAKRICGSMEKQMTAAAANASTTTATTATTISTTGDKLFVKAFLLDDSLNINKWRVTHDSIQKNINSFIGKPLVLTEQFDHPSPSQNQPESLNHWLAYQESFRVGSIIDITTKPNPVTNSTVYYAIIEVTDPDLKQSLKNNTVPLYVSPALAELVPNPAAAAAGNRTISDSEGDTIANWTGVHLAIVSEPAFGIKKAVINEQCGGNEQGCLLQLRKAHVNHHGIGKCGFCVKKALQKYRILQNLAQKVAKDAASGNVTSQNTSHSSQQTSNLAGNYRKMSQLEQTTDSSAAATLQQQPLSTESPQETVAVEKVELQQRPLTKAPIQQQPPTIGSTNVIEMTQTIQNLRHENELLRTKLEEVSNVKDTLGERIAAIELERRREHIERIISPDVIRDEKQRFEKIKYFTATSIPLDQIEQLYKDIKVTLRKASANQRAGGRVPYGVSMGSGGVVSPASQQQSVTIDEETGLTPLQKQLAVLSGGP
jgi:hypothetical protein